MKPEHYIVLAIILLGIGLWGYRVMASNGVHASVTNTSGAMNIQGKVIIK